MRARRRHESAPQGSGLCESPETSAYVVHCSFWNIPVSDPYDCMCFWVAIFIDLSYFEIMNGRSVLVFITIVLAKKG